MSNHARERDRNIKGNNTIHLARVYGERRRNFVGQHFWAKRYFVSTVGRDEAAIRDYIRNQEEEDARLDPLGSLALSRHLDPPGTSPADLAAALSGS